MSHLSLALDKLATGESHPATKLAELARVQLGPTYNQGHVFLQATLDVLIAALPADEDERPAALREIHEDLGPYADSFAERVWEHEADHRAWQAWVDLHLYNDRNTYSDPRDDDRTLTLTQGAWHMLHDVASFLIQSLVDELIEADELDQNQGAPSAPISRRLI